MAKPVEIVIAGRAVATLRQLDSPHRVQFDRLVAALRLSPEAGLFYAYDGEGRILRQVSGADLHVIYTLTYRVQRDRVFIIAIELAEWSPREV